MTQPPKQLPFRHVTCHRHPSLPVTGFCASCLRERLSGIDPDTQVQAPVTRLAAELRRSKSHSASSATVGAGNGEPRRRSCDVRERSSLSDLFHVDDGRCKGGSGSGSTSTRPRFKGLGFDLGIEINEDEILENGDEIRVSEEDRVNWEEYEEENGEFKTMKEFIDLEWERKRNKSGRYSNVGKNLREAASVFGKKLGKFQIKHKRRNGLGGKEEGKAEKEESRSLGVGIVGLGRWRVGKLRETQSEVGEYGFGRRSCDIDPRLSVDAGVGARLSVDDSRRSFDEPRASWDGCLISNGRMHHPYPRMVPPLVSVMEDAKLGGEEGFEEKQGNVCLEKRDDENGSPGGTEQTRDYYCSGRRRSFDRLGSVKRVGLGDDELKSMWNAKVSPETVGLFHGAKLLVTEKELRDSNWYAKDDGNKMVNSHPMDASFVAGGAGNKDLGLKREQSWRSIWNIWGLMQKKRQDKCRDEESNAAENVINGQMEESLQTLRGITNRMGSGVVSQKFIRSYTVSARDSSNMACSTTSGIEAKDNGTKRKEELSLQWNRSTRHSPSPNNIDNGLLRFYLTPLRSYGRSKSGNSRPKNSLSVARDIMQG